MMTKVILTMYSFTLGKAAQVFSLLVLPPLSYVQIFSSLLCTWNISISVFPFGCETDFVLKLLTPPE
jgi:hypothetical protein